MLELRILEEVQSFYNDSMEKADPRVMGFPLAQSPFPFLSILLLYLIVVYYGPKMMEQHKPLNLKWIMVVYNFFMVGFSFWIFSWTLSIAVFNQWSLVCQLIDYRDNVQARAQVTIGWLFFFSKLIELLDTVFFILRKKNSQITFLHVYHHSTIVIVTWSGMKWVPGGQSFAYPLLNTLVHTVMYTYYGIASIGPHMQKYLWWKRYLTIFQLSQFLVIMTHTVVNLFADCEFPKLFDILLLGYMVTILALFLNFYFRAYVLGQRPAPTANGVQKTKRS